MDYRLIQNGEVVAQVSGPPRQAMLEMYRYARTYAQDGPVETEKRVGKKWVSLTRGAQEITP